MIEKSPTHSFSFIIIIIDFRAEKIIEKNLNGFFVAVNLNNGSKSRFWVSFVSKTRVTVTDRCEAINQIHKNDSEDPDLSKLWLVDNDKIQGSPPCLMIFLRVMLNTILLYIA